MSNYEQHVLTDDPGAASDPKPESLLIDNAKLIIDELKKKAASAATEAELDSVLVEMTKVKADLVISLKNIKKVGTAESTETLIEGRDPEKFLKDFFDWSETNRSWVRRRYWNYSEEKGQDGKIFINMGLSMEDSIPGMFIDEKRSGTLLSAVKLKDGQGLESLLEFLKGKKIISVIQGTRLYLEVVKSDNEGAQTEFITLAGVKVLSDGLKERRGFKVGSLIKPRPNSNLRKEVANAKKLELVGFTEGGRFITRIDDELVVTDLQDDFIRYFEVII